MRAIKKQNSIKKILPIILALLIVVGAGAYGAYRYYRQHNQQTPAGGTRPANDINYSPPTQSEKQADQQQKTDIINKDTQNNPSPNPSTSSDITVTITRANQASTGLPLNIRTLINGTTSGTCLIELKKTGQPTVSKTFAVGTDGRTYSCQTADVAAADFSTSGDWLLSVTVQKDTKIQSAPVTQTVTIQK
jgi:hypothetical protein